MRKRFEQQTEIGVKLICETPVLLKSRDDVPALVVALLEIYKTPSYNNIIFNTLSDIIIKDKKNTGRKGLNLWQIFVLAQYRLALDLDYDRLHYMVYSDSTLRQLLGIETETGFDRIEISYQRIIDNVHLLTNEAMIKINDIIVDFGHKKVFKKKETAALFVKTDSFVVESNVHFPTDYNLLWDASRKVIDIINWFTTKYPTVDGWRKSQDWHSSLKNLSRAVGQSSSSGGKGKVERLINAAKKYISKANALSQKVKASKNELPIIDAFDLIKALELDRFYELIDKHIDLVGRRLINGEKIPHEEKLFSLFEEYTEWITKGKSRPNAPVQYGKTVENLVSYLNVGQYIPYNRIVNMFSGLFNTPLSEGSVSNIINRFANRAKPFYEQIRKEIEASKVVGADETGAKMNGEKWWFWTWQNDNGTYITASGNRAFTTVEDNFSKGFKKAVLISDRYGAHLKTKAHAHQICTSHLFRDLNYLIELTGAETIKRLKALLKHAVFLKSQMQAHEFQQTSLVRNFIQRETFKILSGNHDQEHKKVKSLMKKLSRCRNYIFEFLYNGNVPPAKQYLRTDIYNVDTII